MSDLSSLKARPTTYKGIQMRSRLEADYAARLDRVMEANPDAFDPPGWEYESQCFANETGQYLPDFTFTLTTDDGPIRVYVEVKPRILDEAHWRAVTGRMAIIWASEPNAVLELLELDGELRHWHGVVAGDTPWWTLTSPERAVA